MFTSLFDRINNGSISIFTFHSRKETGFFFTLSNIFPREKVKMSPKRKKTSLKRATKK